MKIRLLLFMALLSSAIGFSQAVTTVSGSTAGDAIGNSTTARFNYPNGITNDGGNVYITDSGNHKIKKIFSDNSTASFVGSTQGFVNGTGAAARFNNPTGIVRIAFNDFLVCDTDNNAIRKVTSAGVVTTFAGGTVGAADGTGTGAQFSTPFGIAIDASGNAYVTDYGNKKIRKITTSGVVTTLAGSTSGFTDGTGAAAQFNSPTGIAVDASGNVFVADNNGRAIRKITPGGVVTTFAGGNTFGYVDGNGTAAQFNGINGLSFDGSGNLIVLDTYNYRIRKITSSGNVTTFAGSGVSGNTDGDAATASFYSITSVTKMMTSENLYLTDYNSHLVRKITYAVSATDPTITLVSSSSITSNSAFISYNLNANNAATTSIIKYGINTNALNSQVAGHSATGNSNTSGSTPITGLLPNTQYFYQVEATNSMGTNKSAVLNFTTTGPPQLLANYTFDNTLNDVNGANPFASQTGMTYDTDRSGTASNALFIDGTGTTVSLTNLPVGSSSRTFSIWIKPTQNNSSNRIFSYGLASGTAAYGASFDATKVYNFSWTNNLSFLQATNLNVWKHIVCTYEQSTSTASLYIDGILRNSGTFSWNTTDNGILYLGSLFGDAGSRYIGFLDDLQIYNNALSQAEVTNLFNGNSVLSSENFSQNNLEVSLYPNPVNNVLNIETALEIQNVEIYNIQGQKVMSSNQKQINVSDLASGIYMIRIQDSENAVATKKIVKQ